MATYSKERRRAVLAASDAGGARKFGCSESLVRRVKQERREQGKTEGSVRQVAHIVFGLVPVW